MTEYSDFIDEFIAVRATFGKYIGARGMSPEENEIIVEAIKAKQLIEMKDTLEKMNDTLGSALNYADERNGVLVGIEKAILQDDRSIRTVADVLVDTNSKIGNLREAIFSLR